MGTKHSLANNHTIMPSHLQERKPILLPQQIHSNHKRCVLISVFFPMTGPDHRVALDPVHAVPHATVAVGPITKQRTQCGALSYQQFAPNHIHPHPHNKRLRRNEGKCAFLPSTTPPPLHLILFLDTTSARDPSDDTE